MGRQLLIFLLGGAVVFAVLKFHPFSKSPNEANVAPSDPQPAIVVKPVPDAAVAVASPSVAPSPAAVDVPPAPPVVQNSAAAVSVVEPTPAVRKAPPGYLYVLRHISKTTADGVIAVDPGQKLAIMSRGTVKTALTDGRGEFEIDNDYLTDDTDVAEMARKTDAQSQASLAAWLQRKAISDATQRAADSTVKASGAGSIKRRIALVESAAAASSTTPSEAKPLPGTSLDRPAYDQHSSVPPWWYRYDRWGRQYYVDRYGRWVYY